MMTDAELIAELRSEFEAARDDPAALHSWFTRYKYLTQEDFSKVSGISLMQINKLMRKVGVPKKTKCIPKYRPSPKAILHGDPTDTTWMHESVNAFSKDHVKKSLRITNVDRWAPGTISGKNVKLPNPYFNEKWIREHYQILRWNKTRCAKAAGVSRLTFNRWLAKFNIQ